MLGSLDRGQVLKLLSALADGQASSVMEAVKELAEQAPDFEDILAELISQLHYIALLQQVPDAYDESMGDKAALEALAKQISPEDIQLYYQIGLMGRRDLPLAPEPRAGLEMVLLRMLAFRPDNMSTSQATTSTQQVQAVKKSVAKTATEATQVAANEQPAEKVQQTVATKVEEAVPPQTKPAADSDWHEIASQLTLGGVDKQVAMNCALISNDNDNFVLALEPASAPMLTKERQARIQDALSNLYGRELRISIEAQAVQAETPAKRDQRVADEKQANAESEIKNDSNVQSILEAFDGTVKPNSVQVVDET